MLIHLGPVLDNIIRPLRISYQDKLEYFSLLLDYTPDLYLQARLEPYLMEPLMVGSLAAVSIRLEWKCLSVTNTLAYYDTKFLNGPKKVFSTGSVSYRTFIEKTLRICNVRTS